MRLIPAIDLRAGHCVRLLHGDFEAETVYPTDPDSLLHKYREAVRRYPQIEWQASGGIRNAHDLHALSEAGAAAAISGKALLENLIPIEELQPFLPNA